MAGLPEHVGLHHLAREEGQGGGQQERSAVLGLAHAQAAPDQAFDFPLPGNRRILAAWVHWPGSVIPSAEIALRFTVAIPPLHRSSLEGRLGRELRKVLDWVDAPSADVLIGVPGEGTLAMCPTWPGVDGALALIEAGYQRLQDRRNMERLHEVGRALASEQNLDKLLDLILIQARQLLAAEAGSIYLVVGEGAVEGTALRPHPERQGEPSLPSLQDAHLDEFHGRLRGHHRDVPEHRGRLPDPRAAPYRFNDSFDRQARLPHHLDAGGAPEGHRRRGPGRPAAHQPGGRGGGGPARGAFSGGASVPGREPGGAGRRRREERPAPGRDRAAPRGLRERLRAGHRTAGPGHQRPLGPGGGTDGGTGGGHQRAPPTEPTARSSSTSGSCGRSATPACSTTSARWGCGSRCW